MNKIAFSLMQVLVESNTTIERFKEPTYDTFSALQHDTEWIGEDGSFYKIEIEKDSEYLWLYFQFGNAAPRSETVTNVYTGEQSENLRKENEAELLHQLFVLYAYKTNTLYISNAKKIKLIQQFLKEKTNQHVEIKHFFKEPEEMIQLLDSVSSIKFTSSSNLFSQDSKERQALVDLTGTDAPETFTIEATYKSHKIKNYIRKLIQHKNDNQIQNLVVCGRDVNKMDLVYNIDTLTHKIEVSCEKEEGTGLFTADVVKSNLLNTLSL